MPQSLAQTLVHQIERLIDRDSPEAVLTDRA